MSPAVSHVVQLLAHAAEPWKTAYADSTAISVAVVFGHLGALLIGGGVAVSTDLASFRALRAGTSERRAQVESLHRAHRVVVGALVVLGVTGILLAASDVETFAESPWFWVKISLVILLCLNGWILYRTGLSLRRGATNDDSRWRRLRTVSAASLFLWLATTLAGTILQIAS